ncbi:MAG: UDP-N-acetylmuramoyl-L-alanine--D-glutamate ligase [Gammaproteobacteria bacterium]|nr:MAG: UDP-N-acetylmuramoyl-L-alanine--D-glutamate ligase [Gammaproteobacteria bacterium]
MNSPTTRESTGRFDGVGLSDVLGLGVTGLSCARYLTARGHRVLIVDSREQPPGLEALRLGSPGVEVWAGTLDVELPPETLQVVVSPGLPTDTPIIDEARRRGIDVLGDIELFARVVDRPVAAITGSNGKSTVTTMVADMARRAGRQMPAGGNLGTPALDLLQMPAEAYLLELSSFQLELTNSLSPAVATVLNVSVDHIDRHGSLADYAAAKARVFQNARLAVANREDPEVMEMVAGLDNVVTFGPDPASRNDYGVVDRDGCDWLARGDEALMPTGELGVPGAHNVMNALAALAIGSGLGLPMDLMLAALRAYRGLPHRTQLVSEAGGISWINDSKATNVGAAMAAVRGLGDRLVLIAGGDGKGADFLPLAAALRGRVRGIVLLGQDAAKLAEALEGIAPIEMVSSMATAVEAARNIARPGDTVLLSPACSSLDMFESFAARGEAFRRAVQEADE